MKKIRHICPLTLGLAVFLFSSCPVSFEMPEKIRIVASPDIALVLPEMEETAGRLFGEAIKGAFADQRDMTVYDWQTEKFGDIQTYLLHNNMEPISFTLPSKDEIENYGLDQDGEELELIKIEEIKATLAGFGPFTSAGDIPENQAYFTLNLGEKIQRVKIGAGPSGEKSYLELGNAGDDYCKVDIQPEGGKELAHIDGRKFDLTGTEIFTSTASKPTKLYVYGTAQTVTASSGINIKFGIQKFEEITATVDEKKLKANAISLASLPKGTNYITFSEVGFGVRAEFTRRQSGRQYLMSGVQVKDLVIDMNIPELGIDSGGTGKLVTDPDDLEKDIVKGIHFSQKNYILHFAGGVPQPPDGYSIFSFDPNKPRKINIGGTISSEDRVIIYNLPPGPYDLGIRVIPEVISEWENIHVDLEKFMEGKANTGLSGSFPKGKELDLSSMFGSTDNDEMDNVNFDRMDLYLYVGGDQRMLKDSAIQLAAKYGTQDAETLLTDPTGDGYDPFENIAGSGNNIPDFAGLPADEEDSIKVYSGELEPAQFELTDNELAGVFNQWPKNLRLEYKIRLASDFEFLPDDLDPDNKAETPALIRLKPDLLVSFPLKFKLLAPEGDTGDSPEGKLVLGNVFPEGDFLKRESEDDEIDQYIRQLTYLTLNIDYTNTIGLDRASVYLVSKGENPEDANKWEKVIPLVESTDTDQPYQVSLEFTAGDLGYPFTPKMEIRVPAEHEENGRNYGLIEIKRGTEEIPAGFKARVSVRASAEINQEIDL
jgi:hypothetical protein